MLSRCLNHVTICAVRYHLRGRTKSLPKMLSSIGNPMFPTPAQAPVPDFDPERYKEERKEMGTFGLLCKMKQLS